MQSWMATRRRTREGEKEGEMWKLSHFFYSSRIRHKDERSGWWRGEVTTVRTVACINDAFDGPNFSVTFKRREYPFYLYNPSYGSVTSCSQKKTNRVDESRVVRCPYECERIGHHWCIRLYALAPMQSAETTEKDYCLVTEVLLSRRSLRAKSHFLSSTPAIYFHFVPESPEADGIKTVIS